MKYPGLGKFLGKLVLILLVLVAADQLIGWTVEKLYFKQKVGQQAQTTYSVDSAHEDVLIFGSSRAVRHYAPSLITESTGFSCYNVGRDAERVPYYAALQEVILKRCTPKLMILDVNPDELSAGDDKYLKLSILLPYCRQHPELGKYIQEISDYEKYKLLSRSYPYNSMLFIMGYNLLLSHKVPKDDHGYQPLTSVLTEDQLNTIIEKMKDYHAKRNPANDTVDPKGAEYYKQFLDRARQQNIKTVIIISPTLLKGKNTPQVTALKNISAQYSNCTFLDYSQDPKYNYKAELFSDMFHLNKTGTEMFSRELAIYLKNEKIL